MTQHDSSSYQEIKDDHAEKERITSVPQTQKGTPVCAWW